MNRRFEKITWGRDFISRSYLIRSEEHQDQKASLLYSQLNPFIRDFYNPLNPLVLMSENNVEALSQKDTVMIRDGLIPLTYFFRNPPDPHFPTLFIHKKFWYLVPEKWRSYVHYYSLESNENFNEKNRYQRVLLAGLTNGIFIDQVEFSEDLDFLIESLGSDLSNIQFSVYLPEKRMDLWGSWGHENILQVLQILFKKLGTDIVFPKFEDICLEVNFKGSLYFEFNRGHLLKETFLKNLVLSRGAHFLEKIHNEDDAIFDFKGKIPASLSHCINLYKLDEEKAAPYTDPTSSEYFFYFKEALHNSSRERQLNPSWNNWFLTFLKRYSTFKDNYNF